MSESEPRYPVLLTWAELHWLLTALSQMMQIARHFEPIGHDLRHYEPIGHHLGQPDGNSVRNRVSMALIEATPRAAESEARDRGETP